MVDNMKVALCLHGLFDSTTDSNSLGMNGYSYIKKHILDVYDTDVYIHSWEDDKSDFINSLYSPKKAVFEKQFNFNKIIKEKKLDKLPKSPRTPFSVLSHFYSIQKSFELLYLDSDVSYDMVIKARFDLGQINRITSPFNVECIQFDGYDLSKINMANWPDDYMLNEGPPDMWFYSNFNNMKSFSNIYDSIEQYMTLETEFSNSISQRLGIHNISNSSVLYTKFFQDNNMWNNRNVLNCKKN
jgi:hypothetical protein